MHQIEAYTVCCNFQRQEVSLAEYDKNGVLLYGGRLVVATRRDVVGDDLTQRQVDKRLDRVWYVVAAGVDMDIVVMLAKLTMDIT